MSDRSGQWLRTVRGGQFVSIVLAATMSSLILIACSHADTAWTVPTGATPGALTVESCMFKAEARAYQADCGTLVVPEHRARVDSRLIALPVIRVHATGNHPAEPIFWLTGGPG